MSGSPIAASWPSDRPDYGYSDPFAQGMDDQLSIPQGLVSQTSATMLPNTVSNPMPMGPFSINSFNTGHMNHSLAAAGLESNCLASGSDLLPGGYNMGYGSFIDAQQNIPATSHSPAYHHECAVRTNGEEDSATQDATVSCSDDGSEQQKDEPTATRKNQTTLFRCRWEGCTYKKHFGRDVDLLRHVKHIHVLPRSFPCNVGGCSKTFNRKDNLKDHLLKKHPRS